MAHEKKVSLEYLLSLSLSVCFSRLSTHMLIGRWIEGVEINTLHSLAMIKNQKVVFDDV